MYASYSSFREQVIVSTQSFAKNYSPNNYAKFVWEVHEQFCSLQTLISFQSQKPCVGSESSKIL